MLNYLTTSPVAIYYSYANNDPITSCIISLASISSMISHAREKRKNRLHSVPRKTLYLFNNVDIIGGVAIASRFSYLHFSKYGLTLASWNQILLFIPAIFLSLSWRGKRYYSNGAIFYYLYLLSIFPAATIYLNCFIY